jgi:hypothetical protein
VPGALSDDEVDVTRTADPRRTQSRGAVLDAGSGPWKIELVVLAHGGSGFVLRADGSRLQCLSVSAADDGTAATALATFVEDLVRARWQIDVSYLGLLACRSRGDAALTLLVATVLTEPSLISDGGLRIVRPDEVRSMRTDLEHSEHFDTALRWYAVAESTTSLATRMRRAIDRSIACLDGHVSTEDGRRGWSQYQDGGAVGLLSTAEAVLAHVYAGVRGDVVDNPAETLESMQNPDGGWQIRRSLVSAPSARSVTESSAACLLALAGVGRGQSDPGVRDGVAWLESQERPDGGWSSTAGDSESSVFATTVAVRALAAYGRTDAVNRGVAWLRAAQMADGGWGAQARSGTDPAGSPEPAYTAYAIYALLSAGVASGDQAVVSGCDYLRQTFRADQPEPWRPTSASSLIDPDTSSRLDYRHFATPWAVIALSRAGHDLSDPVVMDGVLALLELQATDGAWRCGLAPSNSTPVWATHDAVLALHNVLTTAGRQLRSVALERYLTEERRVAGDAVGALLSRERRAKVVTRWGVRLQTAWLSALTVTVVLVVLGELGILHQLESSSGLHRALVAVGSVLVTVAGAVVPGLVTEEYRVRRRRSDG